MEERKRKRLEEDEGVMESPALALAAPIRRRAPGAGGRPELRSAADERTCGERG
jgi:hypothetical protein